jgi:hypothetical protein
MPGPTGRCKQYQSPLPEGSSLQSNGEAAGQLKSASRTPKLSCFHQADPLLVIPSRVESISKSDDIEVTGLIILIAFTVGPY